MEMIVTNQVALGEINIEKRGTVTCGSISQVRQCLYSLGYY